MIRGLWANLWLRYGLTLLLLAAIAYKIQLHHLASALGSVAVPNLIAAMVLTLPFLYLKALRWHAMLQAAGIEATFSEALLSLVGGMGLALLTPARMGELVRVVYIRDPRKMKIAGLVMIDKGFDVLVLCGLSIAGAFALLGGWAGAVMAAVTFVGLAVVYEPRPLSRLLHLFSARLPLRERLERSWSSLETLSARSTSLYIVLTLLSFAVVLLQFGLILASWHSASVHIVFLTFPLVILTNVLPLTIGGLGIREGAAAVLLGHYGVAPADAALAAFLMFALNTALPGVIGSLLTPVLHIRSTAPLDAPHASPSLARLGGPSGRDQT